MGNYCVLVFSKNFPYSYSVSCYLCDLFIWRKCIKTAQSLSFIIIKSICSLYKNCRNFASCCIYSGCKAFDNNDAESAMHPSFVLLAGPQTEYDFFKNRLNRILDAQTCFYSCLYAYKSLKDLFYIFFYLLYILLYI